MLEEEAHKEEGTPQEPLLWTLDQVSQTLHLGRTTLYRLINQEGLPVMHFGRSVRVNPISLRAWLEQREHMSSYE